MERSPRRVVAALVGDFIARYPDEAARTFEQQAPAAVARQLDAIAPTRAAAVLERLPPMIGAQVVRAMREDRAARLIAAMDPGHAVSLLAWLGEDERERRLAPMEPAAAAELRALSAYPPDSAGSHMDPRVVAIHVEATVREGLARLRAARRRANELFVVDEGGRFAGAVALEDLAVTPPGERLAGLVQPVTSVLAMAQREEVVERLEGRRLGGLPVVDVEGRLVGVIRPETLMSVAREDAGADMLTMVGASPEERALSPVTFAVRKRLPWLHINLGTAFLAAAVVGLFEHTIARFTALAVLLPVVAGQSGNTGAQALAVTMRGLVLREVRVRHWLRVALKEGRVALVNGVAVALTTSAGVYVWSRSPGLALIIGVSMVISMLAAGLAGAVIPMVLTASGQDPAQSSSIILTTITDVVGFLSFLGIATLLSGLI